MADEEILDNRCREFAKLSWFSKWNSWSKFKQRIRAKIILICMNRINKKRRMLLTPPNENCYKAYYEYGIEERILWLVNKLTAVQKSPLKITEK
jgi:hypothetical protein